MISRRCGWVCFSADSEQDTTTVKTPRFPRGLIAGQPRGTVSALGYPPPPVRGGRHYLQLVTSTVLTVQHLRRSHLPQEIGIVTLPVTKPACRCLLSLATPAASRVAWAKHEEFNNRKDTEKGVLGHKRAFPEEWVLQGNNSRYR
jgi:hypothetical protein